MRAKNEKEPTSSLSLSTGSLRMVWGHIQELFPALCPANLFPNILLYLLKGLEKTAVLFSTSIHPPAQEQGAVRRDARWEKGGTSSLRNIQTSFA